MKITHVENSAEEVVVRCQHGNVGSIKADGKTPADFDRATSCPQVSIGHEDTVTLLAQHDVRLHLLVQTGTSNETLQTHPAGLWGALCSNFTLK